MTDCVEIKKGNEYFLKFYSNGNRRGSSLLLIADKTITFKYDDKKLTIDNDGSPVMYRYTYEPPHPLFDNKPVHYITWQENIK